MKTICSFSASTQKLDPVSIDPSDKDALLKKQFKQLVKSINANLTKIDKMKVKPLQKLKIQSASSFLPSTCPLSISQTLQQQQNNLSPFGWA